MHHLFLITTLLTAQIIAPFPEGTVKILGQRLSVGHVVKNAPYQALAITEMKQALADGNEIARKSVARMCRDSLGRVRLEQIEPVTPERVILVQDPENRTGFSYNPASGRLQTYGTKKNGSGAPVPGLQGVPLGRSVVDGVSVEGTRQVTVIPAGQVGNVKPLEIVEESWYSPELQVIIKSTHRDPRSGTLTYRLSAIERKEPEAKLFEIPAGALAPR